MSKSRSTVAEIARIEYRELERKYARFYLDPIAQWANTNNLQTCELACLLRVNSRTMSNWIRGTRVPVSKISWRKIDRFNRRHSTEPSEDLWAALKR
jgi:hypothetical protein